MCAPLNLGTTITSFIDINFKPMAFVIFDYLTVLHCDWALAI